MPYDCAMEKLKTICEGGNPSISDLAGTLGVAASTVSEWCSGRRPVPIRRCIAVENATGGRITRRELRPDDWADIWPELDLMTNATQTPASRAVAATENVAQGVA